MSRTCPTCRTTYPEGTVQCPVDTSALLPEEAFANADPLLEPGTMIGEYRVERKLGEGSFGTVYAGVQPLIGKKVAIKLLHQRMSSEPEIVLRFIDEARAVNKIGHRNIIDVFSFGVFGGIQHYFVMEFCEGMTLGQLLHLKKRLSPMEALPILRGIADGLDAAHLAGVTHRDLKPDNVFLVRIKDNQYFPKLLDFGVAKLAQENASHQTATGVAIGTPRYMSPEQCQGKRIDHRTDIYALGCVAHEMLTGKPVFDADSTVDLLFKQTMEQPPAMSSIWPNLPPELDAPILEMLAKRPLGRPNSAGLAINALADAIRLTRSSKPSIPPSMATGTADTVRVPIVDAPQNMPNDSAPTIPADALHTQDDSGRLNDSIPATRKSLTEFQIADAMRAQIPPDSGNTEIASGPPIHSQMPATLASTPLTGAVVDRMPEVKVLGAHELTKTVPGSGSSTPSGVAGLAKKNSVFIAGGLVMLLGAGAIYLRRPHEPTATTATTETVPSQTAKVITPERATITLRAKVTPNDARIVVDGRDLGSASDAIHLPREKKEHAVRIERKGYESQTMWVTADADKQLGPITLLIHAVTPAASTSASAKKPITAPSGKPVPSGTTKTKLNKVLLKPKPLGTKK